MVGRSVNTVTLTGGPLEQLSNVRQVCLTSGARWHIRLHMLGNSWISNLGTGYRVPGTLYRLPGFGNWYLKSAPATCHITYWTSRAMSWLCRGWVLTSRLCVCVCHSGLVGWQSWFVKQCSSPQSNTSVSYIMHGTYSLCFHTYIYIYIHTLFPGSMFCVQTPAAPAHNAASMRYCHPIVGWYQVIFSCYRAWE